LAYHSLAVFSGQRAGWETGLATIVELTRKKMTSDKITLGMACYLTSLEKC
jgi:hypothetical protein